ncbi:hypothetical protein BH11VER1_BH11VER1_30290 [soil metagenome]
MNLEKLTAYALNELPPDERAELEALIQSDPALKQQAEDLKSFCALLDDQVSVPEEDTLTGSQRQDLLQAFKAEQKIIRPFWKHPVFVSTTALAACITAAFLMTYRSETIVADYAQIRGASEEVTVLRAKKQVVEKDDQLAPPQIAASVLKPNSTLPKNEGLKVQAPSEMPVIALNDPKPIAPMMSRGDKGAASGMGSLGELAKNKDAVVLEKENRSSAIALPGAPETNKNESPNPTDPTRRVRDKQVAAAADGRVTLSGSIMQPAMPAPTAAAASPQNRSLYAIEPAQKVRERISGGFIGSTDMQDDKFSGNGKAVALGNEAYAPIQENAFMSVAQAPLSTFSIDVDTASYANVRRFLNQGQRPPADAVRLEELINYFPYPSYEPPSDDKPFAVHVDMAEAPWNPTHRLARIALKGRVSKEDRGAANFVFLVDISGSMDQPDKLPLVRQSLQMLTEQLEENDRVAIVTYAGQSGVALESTTGAQKSRIIEAINQLHSGGSTNGASGIRLAYEQATQHFQKEGVNRVILCTDGDFNVGISSPDELEKLIKEKAKSKVFLSVLGFGTGNLKDHTMETLADKGNGNYAYIDSLSESRKVLVEQMGATLVTIAKDVKIQVEFNPTQVQAYRLLGYENRVMAKEDFNNDRKDAGEIGAGHTVTALYEVVPANIKFPDGKPVVDDLKYANKLALPAPVAADAPVASSTETMTVKLRYKKIDEDKSLLLEVPFTDKGKKLAEAPRDFQFATSLAGFGMLLRDSQHSGELTWDMVRKLAISGKGEDELGYRGEFIQLIEKARGLTGSTQGKE